MTTPLSNTEPHTHWYLGIAVLHNKTYITFRFTLAQLLGWAPSLFSGYTFKLWLLLSACFSDFMEFYHLNKKHHQGEGTNYVCLASIVVSLPLYVILSTLGSPTHYSLCFGSKAHDPSSYTDTLEKFIHFCLNTHKLCHIFNHKFDLVFSCLAPQFPFVLLFCVKH